MNNVNKLYLLLSLLLTATVMNTQEHKPTSCKTTVPKDSADIIKKTEDNEDNIDNVSIEEEIDQELYKVFNNFFDDHDTTPFSKIVMQVINLLKRKKLMLHGDELKKCDEIIKLIETHAADYRFYIWANILINPDLLNLMSPETRTYIHNVSNQKKITSLIRRLRNPHYN